MISLIWAMDPNNLIGKDNSLPWSYPKDLNYFRDTTRGHTVVMGENTFYSIGRPLPNRTNIVATLSADFKEDGVIVINDLISYLQEHSLKLNGDEEEIFIIGGKQIYALSLPYADKLYITHIKKVHEGNIYFPNVDYSKFNKVSSIDYPELEFAVYEAK